jgi:hypothetical protein
MWGPPIPLFRHAVLCAAAGLCIAGCFAPVRAALPSVRSKTTIAKSSEDASDDTHTTKLHLRVVTNDGKPVGNASVYVRFYTEGGLLHHDKLAELDLKTNQDGTVKVPPIPQGKILIQVIAKGWHTFGKWYDVEKDEQSIEIHLEPPPHWY